MLTIFTPTYNRAFILPELHDSLLRQTSHDLEWIIVDDGSTDDTETLVQGWKSVKPPFPIIYRKQANGGKHRAINCGVTLARGSFFFIVDSDDRLPADAVETILRETAKIEDDPTFAGLIGLRGHFDGTPSGDLGQDSLDGHIRTVRYHRRMKQDMAEVIRTDHLRAFPFPEIPGEYFCTEALVWNRLDRHYRFRFLNRVIYLCEYLDDGLSAHYMQLLHHAPVSSSIYYSELARDRMLPLRDRLRSIISFWRYYDPRTMTPISHPAAWGLLRPIGRWLRRKDQRAFDQL